MTEPRRSEKWRHLFGDEKKSHVEGATVQAILADLEAEEAERRGPDLALAQMRAALEKIGDLLRGFVKTHRKYENLALVALTIIDPAVAVSPADRMVVDAKWLFDAMMNKMNYLASTGEWRQGFETALSWMIDQVKQNLSRLGGG